MLNLQDITEIIAPAAPTLISNWLLLILPIAVLLIGIGGIILGSMNDRKRTRADKPETALHKVLGFATLIWCIFGPVATIGTVFGINDARTNEWIQEVKTLTNNVYTTGEIEASGLLEEVRNNTVTTVTVKSQEGQETVIKVDGRALATTLYNPEEEALRKLCATTSNNSTPTVKQACSFTTKNNQ